MNETGAPVSHAREIPPALFGPRLASIYSTYFFTTAVFATFFPYWLAHRGLAADSISFVMAAPLAARVLFSGPISAYGDRAADRANVVVLLSVLAFFGYAALEMASGFVAILVVVFLMAAANSPIIPVVDSIVLSGVRRYDADYGKIRLWGSIVFLLAGIAVGWLVEHSGDADIVVHLLVFGAAITAISALTTPRIGARRNPPERGLARMAGLLRKPGLAAILASNALIASCHGMLFTFATLYWLSIGLTPTAVGILWAIGTLAEVAVFQFARQLLRRTSPATLMMIGGLGGVVRWLAMPFDWPFAGFAALQTLHALTFGATHLGTMHWFADHVEERDLSVVNGATFVAGGACMGVSVLASGWLYARFGAGAFGAMALPALGGAVAALMARRSHPHSVGVGGKTSEPS